MGHASGQQFGDYRLGRMIGDGGFAEVYEADHIHLPGDKAAVKLLKGGFTPRQIEELRREALMVSKLNHPHIIQLRTFSVERSIPYLVMTYAQGGTLKQKHPPGTRLALSQILTYVHPIATALQYAHEQRIVHRDLKPANILLTQDGRVQVADFGIAVMSHSSRSRTMQEIIGTWVYMAPEQFKGQAEPASDQYTLAIMVYQWLCGTVPFKSNGNFFHISKQHLEAPPPPLRAELPDLLPVVEDAIMKALAKDPKQRFASIMEFAEALEEASHPPFVIAPGQCLGGYKLIRKLGEGGFAEVYEAEHLLLGTRAAMKLLKGTFTPEQVEGLRQEARAIIQLDHPRIIRAYDFGIERNVPYLIMAYATGGSLATRHEMGTPLSLDTIREYVHQIAAALHYAHSQQITHRDIKPENILLAADGRIQVADFGIAIMAQNTQSAQEIVGSWTYMAPEQFEGKAEPASDQYALGIMVYQWLCGDPPFTGNGSIYALPHQHMYETPPSPCDRLPGLSSCIEQVMMKALAKLPTERYDSIRAFARAFEEACTKPPTGTTSHTPTLPSTPKTEIPSTRPPAGTNLFTYEHSSGGCARAIAWSPDGTRVTTGGRDAAVRIWDPATGETLFTVRGHTRDVNAVAWSPDGSQLAFASDDKSVQVWMAGTSKLLLRYEGHTSAVNTVAWSPDGSQLASASGGYSIRSDNSVQVWMAGTGSLLLRYEGHTSAVNAVAWSPDGSQLASASRDETVQVWMSGTGKLLRRYNGHTSWVNAVAWSPDGNQLASASDDKSVQVWTAGMGKLLRRYEGHSSSVMAVVWSPDGRLLASASQDKTVRVWEVSTGKVLLTYRGHSTTVRDVTWSPDGERIVSAGLEVQVWVAPR